MIRIKYRSPDNVNIVSTFFYNKKWITFLHTLGQDTEQLTTDSLLLAGQNHLTFLKRIYYDNRDRHKKQKPDQIGTSLCKEQSQEINSSIEAEKIAGSEEESSIQSNQETQLLDGEESSPSSNQKGSGSSISPESGSNQTETAQEEK